MLSPPPVSSIFNARKLVASEPDKNVDQKNVYISPQLKNFLRTMIRMLMMLFQNACGSLLEYFLTFPGL